MHQFTIQQASLSFRWLCRKRMLAALPLPGTPSFFRLITSLQSFNVTPQDVAVESPSNRLGDLALTISLARREILVRITYAGFEILIGNLLDDHTPLVPPLADALLRTLLEIDQEAADGLMHISYTAHLTLPPGVWQQVLSGHLTSANLTHLAPDAFSYRVRPKDRPDILDMRIVVARSVLFKEALFVDFGGDYTGELDFTKMATRIRQDIFEVLGTFHLERGN